MTIGRMTVAVAAAVGIGKENARTRYKAILPQGQRYVLHNFHLTYLAITVSPIRTCDTMSCRHLRESGYAHQEPKYWDKVAWRLHSHSSDRSWSFKFSWESQQVDGGIVTSARFQRPVQSGSRSCDDLCILTCVCVYSVGPLRFKKSYISGKYLRPDPRLGTPIRSREATLSCYQYSTGSFRFQISRCLAFVESYLQVLWEILFQRAVLVHSMISSPFES